MAISAARWAEEHTRNEYMCWVAGGHAGWQEGVLGGRRACCPVLQIDLSAYYGVVVVSGHFYSMYTFVLVLVTILCM